MRTGLDIEVQAWETQSIPACPGAVGEFPGRKGERKHPEEGGQAGGQETAGALTQSLEEGRVRDVSQGTTDLEPQDPLLGGLPGKSTDSICL